jgi:L-fucose dehydrogenase
MDLGLRGKVVVVTGGASGIGAAVSELLAEEEAIPVIVTRRPPDDGFLAGLRARVPKAGWVLADLARDADCRRAVEQVREGWGPVYALVNNAGANDKVGIEAGPEAFRASLEQNLTHYYTLVHLLLPDLRAAKGAVVNVSSKTAVTGQGSTSDTAAPIPEAPPVTTTTFPCRPKSIKHSPSSRGATAWAPTARAAMSSAAAFMSG